MHSLQNDTHPTISYHLVERSFFFHSPKGHPLVKTTPCMSVSAVEVIQLSHEVSSTVVNISSTLRLQCCYWILLGKAWF